MTVTTTLRRVTYVASGSDTFAYTFLTYDEDWLFVYVDDVLQTITTDYTVTGVGNPGGGNIVFEAGSIPTAGQVVLILRTVPRTQEIDYQDGSKFPADSHEQALDKLTMIDHQYDENIVFGFKFSDLVTDAGETEITADVSERAGKVLGFDAGGDLGLVQDIGTWRSVWETGISYIIGDIVIDGVNGAQTQNIYRCTVNHTSGVWATDLAQPYWELMVDVQTQILATVVLTATPADGDHSGYTTLDMDAGETVAKFDVLYVDATGELSKADATDDTKIPVVAMALEAGTDGNPLEVLHWGFITNSGWSFTLGAPIYADTSAGGITETQPSGSGEIVQIIGYALTATTIFFKPDHAYVELL